MATNYAKMQFKDPGYLVHGTYGSIARWRHQFSYPLLILLFWLCLPLSIQAQETRLEDHSKKGLEETNYYDESGKPRPDLFRRSTLEFSKVKNGPGSSLGNLTTWDQIGPAPANVNASLGGNGQLPGPNAGAVIDIAIDPRGTKDSIIYIASNSGGVWKSTDGGKNWTPKTDFLPTLSVGAIALDDTNPDNVYLGTGNIFNNGYIMALGIYISSDGGDTWNETGDKATLLGKPINKMAIPSPGVILVATQNGFFRSTDNGERFREIHVGNTTGAYITDLDFQEGNANNVWVAIEGVGIFASTDGGATFGDNLWGSGHGEVPTDPYVFVSMGVSSDGETIFANAENESQGGVTLWKTTSGGDTWDSLTQYVSTPLLTSDYSWRDINACQCGYDQTMGVDPSDDERVYMGFQDMWISEDGGEVWNNATLSFAPEETSYVELMHVDHHALVYSPPSHRVDGQPVKIWVGTDGGVWSSTDNGRSWLCHNEGETPSTSLATHLFRYIDTGRGNVKNDWTYGGTQDNGTSVANPDNAINGGPTPWNEWTGGDGSFAAVHWNLPQIAYSNWGQTTDGGMSYQRWSVGCEQAGFNASIVQAAYGPYGNTVYFGGSCDSTNASNEIVKQVPTLFATTNNRTSFTQVWQPTGLSSDKINSIAVTPAGYSLLYLTATSTDWNGGGTGYKLTENGDSFDCQELNIAGVNGQSPIMAVSLTDSDLVAAVFAGYSNTQWPTPSKHVFFSKDGGSSWIDISGTMDSARIPDMPIYDVSFDANTEPQSILVSSDFGVFRTFDFGLTWHVVGNNLPNVHTVSLAMDATVRTSILKAGTFGRSVWKGELDVANTVFGPYSGKTWNVGDVTWINQSNETLAINWIPSGASQEYTIGKLQPGESLSEPAYFINPYVIRDQSENIIFVYLPRDDSDQVVTISQGMVNQSKANLLKAFPGIRTLPYGQQVSNFTVVNATIETINIEQVNEDGISNRIGVLNSAQFIEIGPVYGGGAFVFTDAQGRYLATYTASASPDQQVTITNDILDYWSY